MTAIEHINYRHGYDSGFKNVSKFAKETSVSQIKGYVDDALRRGMVTPNGENGYAVRYQTGENIGTDKAGDVVTGIQIYVRDGKIRTAFPVKMP